MKDLKIHHIGFVTKSIVQKRKEFSVAFNWKDQSLIQFDKDQKVKVQFLYFENLAIELIEPAARKTPITKFLKKSGEGLHHICFEVPDIQKTFLDYQKKGFRIAQEIWVSNPLGRKVFFLHPKSTGGLLLEFIEMGE